MIRLLTGLILGIACGLVGTWLWSIRKQEMNEAKENTTHENIIKDINWFVEIDSFPKLIYKSPGLAETLAAPEEVSVYRIVDGEGEVQLGHYSLAGSRVASQEQAEDYSKIFCSPTSVTQMSACVFSPGFAVSFKKGETRFFALVCYSCSDIILYDPEANHVGGFGMTKEAEAALAFLFQQAFPDDPEVQVLKF